ncbi:hypothetical protein SH661x_002465 [Planctomicrobium sp. SH661]|uniref:hypothetical protein n=1 Tax=Planctomicrobium sp. SH661 TaxID=3448124 RepID=UPI003F5C6888
MLISHPDFASGRFTEPRIPALLATDSFESLAELSSASRTLPWTEMAAPVKAPVGAASGCPGRCALTCRRTCEAHRSDDKQSAPAARSA